MRYNCSFIPCAYVSYRCSSYCYYCDTGYCRLLLIPVVAEFNASWGFGVFSVVAVLSFFLATDREAFLIYTLFFGYYPVLFGVMARIKSKVLAYGLKFLIFNAAVVIEVLATIYIFGIPFETIEFLGAFTPVVLLIAANITFIIYDYALKGLISAYFFRFRKYASRFLKLK